MKRRILILSLISAMVLTSFTGCKLFNKTDANVKETNSAISAKADNENAEESIPEETVDEFNITPNVKTSNEQTSEVVSDTNTSNKKTNTPNTQNKSAATSAKAGTASTNTVASTNTAANTNTTQVNTQPVAKTDKERLRDGEYPLAPVHVTDSDRLGCPVIGYYYKSGCSGPLELITGEQIVVQGATPDEMKAKANQILLDRGLGPLGEGGCITSYDSGVVCPDLGPNYNNPVYADEYTVYPDGHIEDAKATFQNPCEGGYMKLSNLRYPGL